ncbi:MAG: STAS domain-containing protein [Candidatus Omnitrophota bacterium]
MPPEKDMISAIMGRAVKSMRNRIHKKSAPEDSILCNGMKLSLSIENDYILVRPQGAVDIYTVPAARKKYKKEELDRHIIIDFADASRVDCSALAALLSLFADLKTHNREIVIINANDMLKGYIEILRLENIINVFNDKKSALKYLFENREPVD